LKPDNETTCNTDLLYSCAHYLVEIDEKSSHNGRFKHDLMMTSDSDLLFWSTMYTRRTYQISWGQKFLGGPISARSPQHWDWDKQKSLCDVCKIQRWAKDTISHIDIFYNQ